MPNNFTVPNLQETWSGLPFLKKVDLLNDLVDDMNPDRLGGRKVKELCAGKLEDFPLEVLGRLRMALGDDGLSVPRYKKMRDLLTPEKETKAPQFYSGTESLIRGNRERGR
jgi:hypothetical protein